MQASQTEPKLQGVRRTPATAELAPGTGAVVTVTVAVPVFPPAVAVIMAEPAATPLTTPDADTVAVAVEALCQAVVTAEQFTPVTSAVSGVLLAICTETDEGEMTTEVTEHESGAVVVEPLLHAAMAPATTRAATIAGRARSGFMTSSRQVC